MISSVQELNELRKRLQGFYRTDEKSYVRYLVEKSELLPESKNRIYNIAKQIIEKIKHNKSSTIDSFLQQYSLSNDEGIALMCLAETLLRIPDDCTIDELIKDKITNQEWSKYLGSSSSLFVNASTWSLMIGSSILKGSEGDSKLYYAVSRLLKNLGEPIIRKAIKQAILMLSKYFVIGETIEEGLEYAKSEKNSRFLYSFDVFGKTAHTDEEAEKYFNSYMYAIKSIGESSQINDCFKSNGISIKLSALYPRYEFSQFDHISGEMLARTLELCHEAKKYNIPLCIDAEEAEKLEISLILFEQLCLNDSLSKWEGLGLTVQAYQKRALSVLDFIEDIAIRAQRKIMVKLVKGGYWDMEIKRTQELGLKNYPVFTRSSYTDVSYLACAQKLLSKKNNFYPCFATHDVYTFSAIMEIADKNHPGFELQRLHGVCKELYDYAILELAIGVNCRIHAPIGKHSDILPCLIRRLSENEANNLFINQVDQAKIDEFISDPLERAKNLNYEPDPNIPLPQDIFGPERKNALGIDISDSIIVSQFINDAKFFSSKNLQIGPIIDGQLFFNNMQCSAIINPAKLSHTIGVVSKTTDEQALHALDIAYNSSYEWKNILLEERIQYLEKAADLIEERMIELAYTLSVEAGKILPDAIAEVREAINFLRYHAMKAKNIWEKLPGTICENNLLCFEGRGVFLCISSWNCPLAFFIRQISAALATGNVVLAKPAKQTPIIAYEVIAILHEAGIPKNVLHFIPGDGRGLGKILIPDNRIAGVAFTGSIQTARTINKMIVNREGPIIPLIDETGGINTMIVDSSALVEQVTTDVLLSAFRHCGQNYSALKILFVQEDIAEEQIKAISSAAQKLRIGDPIQLSTDVGPIIDKESLNMLIKHTEKMSEDPDAKLLSKVPIDINLHNGYFHPLHIYEIQKVSQLTQEICGPVLHIIRFDKSELDNVISDINNIRYRLVFSLHSRIQSKIDLVSKRVSVENVYINQVSRVGQAESSYYLHRFSKEKVINTALYLPIR